MKLLPILLSALLVTLASSVEAKDAASKPAPTIVKELGYKGFNTFRTAVFNAGMTQMLSGADMFTVFAPNDNAFRDLPKAQLDALLADKEKLKGVLQRHIVAGKIASSELQTAPLKTLAGSPLEVKMVDGKVKVETATVVKPDVTASNGVIHGIDKLLLP